MVERYNDSQRVFNENAPENLSYIFLFKINVPSFNASTNSTYKKNRLRF